MIGILDYNLGNIFAFINMYKRLQIPAKIVKNKEDLKDVDKLILPGVGAFNHAMGAFNNSSLRPSVEKLVLEDQIPILGICVGMQMLAESSEEGNFVGLGWISGSVKRIQDTHPIEKVRLPHMGWNDVSICHYSHLFKGLDSEARFYFLHSYFFSPANEIDVLATVEYGYKFPCAVGYRNIMGVQFHPEKSHSYGSLLLQNFATI